MRSNDVKKYNDEQHRRRLAKAKKAPAKKSPKPAAPPAPLTQEPTDG